MLYLQEVDVEDFSEAMVTIPGCDVYVNNGAKKRVASIIRHGTFKSIVQEPTKEKAEVWLRVERNDQRLTLGNIYREWNKHQDEDIEELCERVEKRLPKEKMLLAGDFNLDPSRIKDATYALSRKTANFVGRMEGAGLDRISFGNTFERIKAGKAIKSELDWLLSSHDDMVTDMGVVKSAMSDHSLIHWKICLQQPVQLDQKFDAKKIRKLDKINRDQFVLDMAQQPWEELAGMEEVEDMVEQFHKLFLTVLDEHAPMEEVRVKNKRFVRRPSAALTSLRRKRDNARSKGKLTLLQELRKKCQKLSREEAINQAVERLEKGPQEAWKIVGEVTGKNKSIFISMTCGRE